MKRPLVGIIIGYASGILLGHVCQPAPMALWGGVLAAGTLALGGGKCQNGLLWLLVFLAGWANLVSHTAILSPNDLRVLIGNEPAAVALCGVVAEPTQVKVIDREGKQTLHSLTVVAVTGLRRNDTWQITEGRVMVLTPGMLKAQFFQGQPVEVTGAIEPPALPLAEGLFNYRDYLQTRGIYYELKANSTNDWRLAATAGAIPPITTRFLDWSQPTLARGLPEVDEPLRLIWAMTLGWRTAFTGDIGDPFLRAGTINVYKYRRKT